MKIDLKIFMKISICLVLMLMGFGFSNAQNTKFTSVPIVDLGPDGNLCDNEPRLLNAYNVGCTYEWKFNDSIISDSSYIYASKAGTYSVRVISPDSLEALDTIKLKLVASPSCTIDVVGRLDDRRTAFFKVNPVIIGCTYLWDFNDPTSSSNYSQLSSTSHFFNSYSDYITLKVTSVITGCSNTDTFWSIAGLFESVQITPASFFNVKVSPNPITSSSKLLFTIKNSSSTVSLKAYDLLGREQYVFFENQTYLQGENSIDLSSYFERLESSISILKLGIDGNVISTRVNNIK